MKQFLVLLSTVTILIGAIRTDDAAPTITIAQGTLVGHIYNTSYGSYYAFQGIPYGKPPIGELRFKAPVPADPWNGTYQATAEGSQCVQTSEQLRAISGSEDCLFINVYTSQLPDPENLLPVMVWIHGGGFIGGSGNAASYGPSFLLNDGVVYVSLNYRLGAVGFLSTEDEAAPGNAGMKDQILALRWVQENIAAFGGDPEKVTIFGESAGGASVSLHVVSPMSAGLFRAAIAESGSSANAWSVRQTDTARATAFNLGNALGFTGNTTQELVDFLRTIDAEELVNAATTDIPEADSYRLSTIVFVPVVEPEVDGEEAFLLEHPINILAEGKFNDVYFLTGTNSAESITFAAIKGVLDGTITAEEVNRNFTKIFKPELRYCRTDPCGDEMIAKVKSFYFGDENVTSDNLQTLINMDTDLYMAEGTFYSVEKIAALGTKPVYFYEFSYVGNLTMKRIFSGAANYTGTPHGDDLAYLFDDGRTTEAGSMDYYMRHELPYIWTNFAKTLNPTPEDSNLTTWLPYTTSATYYLDIGTEAILKTDFRKERMDFWKELYSSDTVL